MFVLFCVSVIRLAAQVYASQLSCLRLVGSDVGVAVWTVMVGVLARVHHVGHPGAGPTAVRRNNQ